MGIDNKVEDSEMYHYSEASDGWVALAEENGSSEAESIEFVSTSRSGDDLILELGSGELEVIEDYFSPNFSEKSVEIQGESMDVFVLRVLLSDSAEDVVLTVVGEVSSLEGGAHAVNPFGEKREIQEGDDIFFGEEILLGDASSLSLMMNDASTLTLGSGARMVIDSHVFDESASEGNESLLTLLKGTFLYLSGQVAKQNYDDVGLVTPVGTIGIRGTSLLVEVKGVGEDETMDVVLLSGAVRVRDDEGEVSVVDEVLAFLEVDKEGVKDSGEKADPVSLAEQYGALFYVAGDENLERIAEDLKEQGADKTHVDIFLEEVLRIEELLDSGGDFDFSQLNERDEFDPLSGDVKGVLSVGADSASDSDSDSGRGRVESSLFVGDGEEVPRVLNLSRVVVPVIALLKDTGHKDTGIGFGDKVTEDSGLVFSLGGGDTLVVYDGDGKEVHREKAGADGKITWSPALTKDGEYTYKAQAIDGLGDKSDMSIFSFEYDGTVPGTPQDVGVLALDGTVILSEGGKITTSNLNPTFHVKLSPEEEGSIFVVYRGKGLDGKAIEVGRGVVGKEGVATASVKNGSDFKGLNIGYQFEVIDKAGHNSKANSLTVSYEDVLSLPSVKTAGDAKDTKGKETDSTKSPGYSSYYDESDQGTIVVAKANHALLSFYFADTSGFFDSTKSGSTVGNVELGLFKDGQKAFGGLKSDSVASDFVSFYEDFSGITSGVYEVKFKLTSTNGVTSGWLTPKDELKVNVVDTDQFSLTSEATSDPNKVKLTWHWDGDASELVYIDTVQLFLKTGETYGNAVRVNANTVEIAGGLNSNPAQEYKVVLTDILGNKFEKVGTLSELTSSPSVVLEDTFVYEEGEDEDEDDVSDGDGFLDEGEGGDFDFSEDVSYSDDGVSDDYDVPSVDVL